jgi:2-polyprenyl-6-methoxyphenol hydroxylase-like FAD-dependent oxidoreductase
VRVVIVGAGPTGLVAAAGLARRGHAVTVVDRDAGPARDGSWERAGVMQFHHPHAFRGQVIEVLGSELPDALDFLLAAGAEQLEITPTGGGPNVRLGLRCRRTTFERVLRSVVAATPGVTLRRGHVQRVIAEGGRAAGVLVDGARMDADLVVDASGRSGRVTKDLRGPLLGGDCGVAYVSRQYLLRRGAEFGPMTMPIAAVAFYQGYGVICFPHDAGVFSVVVMRGADDRVLAATRAEPVFEAVAAAVPLLADWTDPARAVPLTPVLPGGRLRNTYCGQLDADGRVPLPGLVFAGDAVCTTNPSAGRGVALSFLQVQRLLALLDEHPGDPASATYAFDAWCTGAVRPWFEDHVECDAARTARWAGAPIDPEARQPTDLLAEAAAADPSLMATVGPYFAMAALPASLDAVRPRVRELLRGGWRPAEPEGPTRDGLADLVARRAAQPVAVAG